MKYLSKIQRMPAKVRMKLAKRLIVSEKAWAFESLLRAIEEFYCRMVGKEIIECFGDSHTGVFWGLNHERRSEKYFFRVVTVRGATALGLGNPNSQTNALNIFKFWLERIPPHRKVLFLMGEVDTGFLLWLRAKKYNLSPERCLCELFGRYKDFLQGVREKHNLLVCSVPLPTLNNYDFMNDNDVARARKEVKVSQLERTRMTLLFNQYLKKWAEDQDVVFLDLDSYSYDNSTGLVNAELINKDWPDHHYNPEAYRKILLQGMLQSGALPQLSS